jgi:cation diffusion facilitator CzcD-associated flavoprotein CzcO
MTETHDVVIVGAGAAGLGCAKVLADLGIEHLVVERSEVGASFARWPTEMRFLTPSFTSNQFGLLDLNAIALNTSPAYSLRREHPSGRQYAEFLTVFAERFAVPVRRGVDVVSVSPSATGGFELETSRGRLQAGFVIWAAGEFQYPRLNPFPGAELCLHNATVRTWSALDGASFVVIGGYESGIDAAIQLCRLGKQVTVLDRKPAIDPESSDPSVSLSPYTLERLDRARATGRINIVEAADVIAVEQAKHGWTIRAADGRSWRSPTRPILATGFEGSLSRIRQLFEWSDDGAALLTLEDESTRTPGLFVSGPQVRHGDAIFCFIYKFRQRFAVVANAIARRLGVDTSVLEVYRQRGMYLDDLSCCGERCAC